MSVRLQTIAALVLVAVLRPTASPLARAECARTFELVTPEDWRCSEENAPRCTICRNPSLHAAELVVHCVEDGTDAARRNARDLRRPAVVTAGEASHRRACHARRSPPRCVLWHRGTD